MASLSSHGIFCYSSSLQASDEEWTTLQGKFLLNGVASEAVIYLEGPHGGTDILLRSLVMKRAKKLPPSPPPDMKVSDHTFGVDAGEVKISGDSLCLLLSTAEQVFHHEE